MNKINYPLGHLADEINRLESQADLFDDPLLAEFALVSKDCLEIGAGVGSTWRRLQKINPGLCYTGIDCSSEAVMKARSLHANTNVNFEIMDATHLSFNDHSFDLVVSKLVLWSIGRDWPKAIEESYRVLKPGGIFYAFEPFDKGVVFMPPCPTLEWLINKWDKASTLAGLDPFIGPKIPLAALKVGFKQVQTKFFPVLALSLDKKKYSAISDNLKHFYFSFSPANPLRTVELSLQAQALKELDSDGDRLIMDSFFVTWGYKL